MQNFLSTFLLLLLTLNLTAQHIEPCGTPAIKSEWLKTYQANPDAYDKGGSNTLYVPVTVHILGTDAGTGYYPIEEIFRTFCQLNVDFEPTNIRFYIEGDLNYIDNSVWYSHDNFTDGTVMMETNNIDSTFNCYIVEQASGAGGYYNPVSDAIALTIGNLDLDTWHTWAHEAGHYFTLAHPFLGWEGIDYNINEPTPDEVSGWGTIPVERMDGSNCTVASDGFCDTPPDYLSSTFQCDDEGFSLQLQKDPDSIFFRSDGGNYMSYATGICNSYFSAEQQAAMRANLMSRGALLSNQDVIDTPVTDLVNITEPAQGELLTEAPTLGWEAVPNANLYYYEVNRLASFPTSLRVKEGIVSDSSVVVYGLSDNKNYYWRVRPLNGTYPCEGEFSSASFMTGDGIFTNVEETETLNNLRLYPNIQSSGQSVRLEMNLDTPTQVSIHLFDMNGQQVNPVFEGLSQGYFSQDIQTQNLSAGLYWIRVQANGTWTQRKLLIFD